MKTNIKLIVVSSFAALALAGCGKSPETQTQPPVTNAVPAAPKPDAATPPPAGNAVNAAPAAPAMPASTNNPAVTNQ